MENKQPVAKFRFLGYKIIKSYLDFNDRDIQSDSINLNIKPTIIEQTEKLFRLNLDVTLGNDTSDFNVNISIIGTFEYESDDKERLSKFFSLNAPAIMFPYIRAYISTITTLSGIPTMLIPTLNVSNLADEICKQIK
jgi:preprotein translocase subunit SecB